MTASRGRTRRGRPRLPDAAGLVASLLVGLAACSGAPDGGTSGRVVTPTGEVEALRARAAELQPEVETLSGLAGGGPVALGIRSRPELETFLVEELERQLPPERETAVVRSYARLGLVPPDLELAPLLRDLLLEQVVGYYDPARDTLWVVAGVDTALADAVLVHEIVHALQDRAQDLDSLLRANLKANDRATAAQAALEGHATLVMLEWQLARLTAGRFGVEDLPDLSVLDEGDLMEAAGLAMPALTSAPRVVRESLLFPYVGGLRFVRARERALGRTSPPLGEAMPETTEQVLHPEKSFGADRDRPVAVRLPEPVPEGWREVHSDGLGELESRIWLEELVGDPADAKRASEGWDGDRYRLLEGPGGEALVWVSAWDTAIDAEEFAAAARDALASRYPDGGRAVDVRRELTGGVATVTVVDAPADVAPGTLEAVARARIGEPR